MQRTRSTLVLAALALVVSLTGCNDDDCPVCPSVDKPTTPQITASATVVTIGDVVSLTASSSHPGGSALTYTWCATGGTFNTATGTAVDWTAPHVNVTTVFTITVVVTDGSGGTSHASVNITVNPPAGVEVIIGVADGNTWIPFYAANAWHRSQVLYLASEVGHAGVIEKLWLMSASQRRVTVGSFEIYMLPTARTQLSTSFEDNYDGGGAVRVYQRSSQSYGSTESVGDWYDFVLDSGYEYAGGNLIIEFRWSGGDPSGLSTQSKRFSTPGVPRTVFSQIQGSEIGTPDQTALHIKLSFGD